MGTYCNSIGVAGHAVMMTVVLVRNKIPSHSTSRHAPARNLLSAALFAASAVVFALRLPGLRRQSSISTALPRGESRTTTDRC